jgi:hypothetical protein
MLQLVAPQVNQSLLMNESVNVFVSLESEG